MNSLRFENDVVIVTGAGGGLGRAYALLFASKGAKVVVNDLGGSSRGEGTNSRAADIVVEEIKKAGGIAVADYNSVEDGEKVVQTALDHFGRIDILVNNAGILRDKSFARISDADWDLVQKVHLRGSFMVTRAAFPHMKKQKHGRIIMTASVAGIYGNFGQANYSSAKMGLVGLSNTLAIEGARYNITCNTVAPMGGTRLTEGILPEELFKEMKPELIAPIVLWLCHRDCQDTGGLFEAAGGWFGKYQWAKGKGFTCRKTLLESVSPEDVRDNWEKITDMTDPSYVGSNEENAGMLASVLEELKENTNNTTTMVNQSAGISGPMSSVGVCLNNVKFTYSSKDLILYALGVGVSIKDEGGIKYLFEGHEEFSALPTFIIVPSQAALMGTGILDSISGWDIDFTKLLHGEHFVEMKKPLEPAGCLSSNIKVTDALDKGSGASLLIHVDTYDETGDLVAVSQFVVFVVGEGGFGGPRTSNRTIPLAKPPQRNPDAIHTYKTSVDQAALYRLNGDPNPLHIEPSFAAMGGFEQPILHGLCSFGVAARAVLSTFCENDVSKFKSIKTRFAKPVIPGQTLVTSMWKEGSRIFFEVTVKENSTVCLSGGYVDLNCTGSSSDQSQEYNLECDKFLQNIASKLSKDSNSVNVHRDIILWEITHGDEVVSKWTFDFPDKEIYKGVPRNGCSPTTTIIVEETNLLKLFLGKVTPQKLYLEDKVKMFGLNPDFKNMFKVFFAVSNL